MGDWLLQTLDTLLNANCMRSRRASCGRIKQRPFPWCQEMSSQSRGHQALVHQGFQEQRAVRAHCSGPLQLLGDLQAGCEVLLWLSTQLPGQGCWPTASRSLRREGTGRDRMGWDRMGQPPTAAYPRRVFILCPVLCSSWDIFSLLSYSTICQICKILFTSFFLPLAKDSSLGEKYEADNYTASCCE